MAGAGGPGFPEWIAKQKVLADGSPEPFLRTSGIPQHLLSPVLKKPLVKRGVVVGLRPGVMPNAGVNGEAHVAAAGPQCVNHPLACCEFDHVVFCTVKGPDRDALELKGKLGEATTTNRCDRCE